jgi:hypothetical protein
MKKNSLLVCIALSFFTLLGASVWEGAAEFSSELPANGLFMATNSFPVNTVVDVTNLENGKIARLIVAARLDSSGFLALLSREAAESLGIHDKDLSRIRMSQSGDPMAFLRLQTEVNAIPTIQDHSLVPMEELTPEIIATAGPLPESDNKSAVAGQSAMSEFSSFMINDFEKGKFYVQIAAYSKTETVKATLLKIDKNLPVAIMNAGSEEKPVYRILIGPVGQGESGAILQRYKADYSDAFVWLGR